VPSLPGDMLDFIASGVAHQVGACAVDGRPVICRALAAAQEADDRLCVAISAESGYEVLDAIRANARVSLVMVAPQSFRALHLKGRDAVVAHGGTAIRPLVEQRRLAFQRQIEEYGFSKCFTHAWYPAEDTDLMTIRFTPFGAWSQTPGPGAGTALELPR
jgi:hypothetical protein